MNQADVLEISRRHFCDLKGGWPYGGGPWIGLIIAIFQTLTSIQRSADLRAENYQFLPLLLYSCRL